MTRRGATSGIVIEECAAADLARCETAWRDLSRRAGEPNPFAEALFLLPAIARLAPGRLRALLAWSGGADRRLEGLVVLRTPRAPFGVADVWRSEQAPYPAITLDRERGEEALSAMLAWLARQRRFALAVSAPFLDADGETAQVFRRVAAAMGLRLDAVHPRRRAALPPRRGESFEAALDKKRRKEWRRQRNRLDDAGKVALSWGADEAAIEAFLALEAAGWKGERGDALATNVARRDFAREMLRGFAADDRLRVSRLGVGDRAIAAGVVLRAQARAFYWKTAFDENLAPYSPGVQLTLEMSRELERFPDVALTDSCAMPDHPMIDRVWPARIDLIDFVVATRPGASLGARFAFNARIARAEARERAKRALRRWLRR